MRRVGLMWLIGLALLLAGCGGDDPPGAATQTPAPPTAASESAPDLPPTWTPGPTDSAAAHDLAGAEQALPPTWTPLAVDSPPPDSDPSPLPPAAPPTWTPLPGWCHALQALEAPETSFTQHPVHLRWVELENAPQYRVELRDAAGSVLLTEVVDAGEYTFRGDLFERAGVYGWEVTPLDASGAATCYAIANEIVVREPPT